MIYSISTKICKYFINQGIIKEENKELYEFGMQQLIISMFNIILTLLIGFVFGMIIQSLFYLLAYIPIRVYAGGFHAKTARRCYCYSLIQIIAVLSVMKIFEWDSFIGIIGMTINSILVFILSPVESSNKPFTKKEQSVFKRKTILILCIEMLVFVFSYLLEYEKLCFSLFTAITSLVIMLALGKLKNIYITKSISE